MSRLTYIATATALVAFTPILSAQQHDDPGRLFARVTTVRGDQYEGFLRWDKNEGHWMDVLDASKRLESRNPRRRSVSILGVRLRMNERNGPTRQSGLRMGHIRTIEVLDSRHALVTLKSGDEQELERSSTDLGNGIQGIELHMVDGTMRDFDWDQIDFVELAPAPAGLESPLGPRLYGSLELANGTEFTGWITWDMDEIFGVDELDGDASGGGGRRSIPFNEIASIDASKSNTALVTLKNGEQITLRGTNDVNSGNRGIAIGDPGLGQVRVNWRQLAVARFEDLPGAPVYPEFDGGRPLRGTVTTAEGTTYTGRIRWDKDEAYTWEFLDGEADGAEFKVEFGLIQTIERLEKGAGARVTLRDGRAFELAGSNDVGRGNNGVLIETDLGEEVEVSWSDLQRVDFTN